MTMFTILAPLMVPLQLLFINSFISFQVLSRDLECEWNRGFLGSPNFYIVLGMSILMCFWIWGLFWLFGVYEEFNLILARVYNSNIWGHTEKKLV